jgi:hypothetical protein
MPAPFNRDATEPGKGVRAVAAQSGGVMTDVLDDYPVDLERIRDDLPYAQRAVVIHQGEDWPTGRFCRNCHDRYPCRLARWGVGVLQAAGWTSTRMAELLARAEAGEVPWQ